MSNKPNDFVQYPLPNRSDLPELPAPFFWSERLELACTRIRKGAVERVIIYSRPLFVADWWFVEGIGTWCRTQFWLPHDGWRCVDLPFRRLHSSPSAALGRYRAMIQPAAQRFLRELLWIWLKEAERRPMLRDNSRATPRGYACPSVQ